MLDIRIRNATVIDGTGHPRRKADVAVADGKIVRVAPSIEQEAVATIDAEGLCLAPGFIDPHSHSEIALVAGPRAESKIRQGVTTEVVGNCGTSSAPLLGAASEEEVKAHAHAIGVDVDWTTMDGYISRLKRQGVAVNVVPLVGHNTVRGCVLGYDDVQPTREQQSAMERLVADAMEQGARGLSTGLYYPPGFYAHTDEAAGLARAAARYGGIYASHIRSESDLLREAVAEAIEIGEKSGARVEIAHVKLEGFRNWEGVDRLFAMLEDAEKRGVRIGCDQYPYVASSTWLAALFPYWAQAGGHHAVAQRAAGAASRAELRQDWLANRVDWDNRGGVKEWSDILVTDCAGRHEIEGLTIAQIADAEHKDPLDVLFDLIAVSDGEGSAVWFDQSEPNVRALMQSRFIVTCSDGYAVQPDGPLGRGKPHPRSYGTFPRVLGKYVREENVLSLEEAIRRMTSVTAERYGLSNRGTIREGACADLVLFDPRTVSDRATFAQPHQFPAGIPYVIVNGVVTIDKGQHTGKLAGLVL
jgi:N-acyl-D-amino-acid deacylase